MIRCHSGSISSLHVAGVSSQPTFNLQRSAQIIFQAFFALLTSNSPLMIPLAHDWGPGLNRVRSGICLATSTSPGVPFSP